MMYAYWIHKPVSDSTRIHLCFNLQQLFASGNILDCCIRSDRLNKRGCSMWVVDTVDTVDRSSGNVFTALPLIVLIHARYSNFIRFIKVHKNKENSFTDWRLAEPSRARTHWYFYVLTRARSSFCTWYSLSLFDTSLGCHQSATAPRSSNFINNNHPFHKLLSLRWNVFSVSVSTYTWFFC